MRRSTLAAAVVALSLVAAGCDTGDGRTLSAPTQTAPPGVPEPGTERSGTYEGGGGTLTIDGEEATVSVDRCIVPDAIAAEGAPVRTRLRMTGTAVLADGQEVIVEAVIAARDEPPPIETHTLSVRFGDPLDPERTLEAQRIVDLQTSEVDDVHGTGTVPLLSMSSPPDAGPTAIIIRSDEAQAFQFGFGDVPSEPAGLLRLEVICGR